MEIKRPNLTGVRVCPICGSTDLMCDAVVSLQQDLNGAWKMTPGAAAALEDTEKYLSTDPNVEVTCGNPMCGTPHDPVTGEDIKEDLTVYWLKKMGYDADTELSKLPQELQDQYHEWCSTLEYNPWHGVLGDTVELNM